MTWYHGKNGAGAYRDGGGGGEVTPTPELAVRGV